MITDLPPEASSKQLHSPFGVLLVNKPLNWTSHDVVAKVRGLSKQKKIGHSGTLDPLATGVLPLYFGTAGRLIEFMPDTKRYTAEVTLGKQSTTWDAEGEITVTASKGISRQQVEALLEKQFSGVIQQTVPPHAAVKVNGKKLYLYARKNQAVELPVRETTIFEINLLSWDDSSIEHPVATIDIACSSGTYIRSIAKELGDALGCGAYLSGLIRTEHGRFALSDCVDIEQLESQPFENWALLNPLPFLPLPQVALTLETLQKVIYGQKLQPEEYEADFKKNTQVALVFENDVVAIAIVEEKGRIKLGKVLNTEFFVQKLACASV